MSTNVRSLGLSLTVCLMVHLLFCSEGTQFTDVLELDKASAEIDEAAVEASRKEYDDGAK